VVPQTSPFSQVSGTPILGFAEQPVNPTYPLTTTGTATPTYYFRPPRPAASPRSCGRPAGAGAAFLAASCGHTSGTDHDPARNRRLGGLRNPRRERAHVCDGARDFRNLIHPGRERAEAACDKGTAFAAVAAVENLRRDAQRESLADSDGAVPLLRPSYRVLWSEPSRIAEGRPP